MPQTLVFLPHSSAITESCCLAEEGSWVEATTNSLPSAACCTAENDPAWRHDVTLMHLMHATVTSAWGGWQPQEEGMACKALASDIFGCQACKCRAAVWLMHSALSASKPAVVSQRASKERGLQGRGVDAGSCVPSHGAFQLSPLLSAWQLSAARPSARMWATPSALNPSAPASVCHRSHEVAPSALRTRLMRPLQCTSAPSAYVRHRVAIGMYIRL